MVDGVQFDLLASGQPVQTGWVASTDGLLVRDLSGDGMINNGTELFGNATVLADGSTASDGYQALAELDANHDGVISSADAVYSQLGVWVDANSDGISEGGEVKTLASLGITEISVNAQVTSTLDHGNTIGLTSSYQTADGASHLAGDVWFAAQDANTYTAAMNTAQLQVLTTAEVVALPPQVTPALAAVDPESVQAAQVNAPTDPPSTEPAQDLAATLANGLAQRSSALAQAIGSFDVAGKPLSASTPSLNVPVDSYGATMRSASLAVGNLVDQMRSFDTQTTAAEQAALGTSAPPALTGMQVAPMGMLDPLKKPSINDFSGLSGIDLKR